MIGLVRGAASLATPSYCSQSIKAREHFARLSNAALRFRART
jgi:hypothetical protein